MNSIKVVMESRYKPQAGFSLIEEVSEPCALPLAARRIDQMLSLQFSTVDDIAFSRQIPDAMIVVERFCRISKS